MITSRVPRKNPRQARSQFTVEAIVISATRIFGECGFRSANTNYIAEKAGVSIGSLYQYFPNKLALLEAVRVRLQELFLDNMSAAFTRGLTLPFEQAVLQIAQTSAAFYAEHLGLFRSIFTELPVAVFDLQTSSLSLSNYASAQLRFLKKHRASLAVDPEQATFFTRNAARGVMHAAVLHRPEHLIDGTTANQISRAFLSYLKGSIA